ncbi:MAG: YeeE/YedE family protein [Pseudomonadota bacterium]
MDVDGVLIACAAGLIGGTVLGLAARLGRFCMMASIEDAVYGDDGDGLRVLSIGAATAIAATALLAAAGWLVPESTIYLRRDWSPAASVLGGLMFGYGMAQVGTCGYGMLARIGGGDLRSLVMAVIIGISAYAASLGPLAPLTAAIHHPAISVDRAATLPALLAGPMDLPEWAVGVAVALALLVAALGGGLPPARRAFWAVAVGLTIAGAWVATTLAGSIGFDAVAVQGFSFVFPLGDTVAVSMTGSLAAVPSFGVTAVMGVVLGAAVAARLTGEVRWEACDDARELRRQMLGAAMMGVGGIIAVGCTVGQGLSALSVLSLSAPVTIAAISAGARLGLFSLVERSV